MSKVQVIAERLPTRVEGDKRQHAPYALKWACPDCKTINEYDYSGDRHFSYPIFGESKPLHLYCDTCADTPGVKGDKGDIPVTYDVAVLVEDEVMVTMPRTEALICVGVLRNQATIFAGADNEVAEKACRMLSERLYDATHKKPLPKTRYDHIGDDE